MFGEKTLVNIHLLELWPLEMEYHAETAAVTEKFFFPVHSLPHLPYKIFLVQVQVLFCFITKNMSSKI